MKKGYLASAVYEKLQEWDRAKQIEFVTHSGPGYSEPGCPLLDLDNCRPESCKKGLKVDCNQDVGFYIGRDKKMYYEFVFLFYIIPSPSMPSKKDGVVWEDDGELRRLVHILPCLAEFLKTCPKVKVTRRHRK
jgi:hypothetical protein